METAGQTPGQTAGQLARIRGIHDHAEHILLGSSAGLNWPHLLMLDFHEPPFSAVFPPNEDHLLLFLRKGRIRVDGAIAGVKCQTTFHPGQLNLVPSGAEVAVTTEDGSDCLHLYIRAALMQQIFDELGGRQLLPHFGLRDPLLGAIILSCAEEMTAQNARQTRQAGDTAYVEHLSTTLAAHLARHYSDQPPARAERQATIPAARLRRVDDYIAAHLDQDIGVADLARVAGYHPVYFARIFRRQTGVSPYQHIRNKRVEAVRLALHSSARLADIAAATGFCNQEHMTRTFRAAHGIPPGRYRKLSCGQR